jgi:hypothetical protein
MVVEVRDVLGQHHHQMAAVDDQHPVQQFAADSSNPSFGDPVRPRCPHWGAQDPDVLTGERGVEDVGEFAVAIPDQEKAPDKPAWRRRWKSSTPKG